ncbi:acriflavin resistance protein [Neiella marina]|uniref:Acriflavin resistance protein n=1 Tax=Neiella marina TaxID=508461 RepID=A0A8J2U7M3_9GAMM|nr:efflux RND transporter permease subunit [Neiella marina]GGA84654.1 acriflavin resistance protein [Neiella marina]
MTGVLRWWVKNPIAANLSMVALVVAGLLSYFFAVEKEPFPMVKQPIMDIRMSWPGAGPKDIEEQILIRFEQALKSVEDVKSITSIAREGYASVKVEGKESVDKRQFADSVREKINAVNSLPGDADRPRVSERVNRREMIRIALHGDADRQTLNHLAVQIRNEISALPLISTVRLEGANREEVSIEISEQKMRLYNLSFDKVATAIRNSSLNSSSGMIRDDAGSLQLTIRSRAEQQQQFEDIVLRRSANGATLYLGDVADVKYDVQEARYRSVFDGEQAVLVEVMNADYMNIVKMSDSVKAYLESKRQQLPPSLKLTLWENWNDSYQSRLSTILNSATSGLILVFILLMLFLQRTVALWVSAGIGVAFAASFALLPSVDVSLNMLSLFAFLMVIGIVVDDAIVIGESIHLANESGLEGDEAAIKGVSDVAKPVLFGVLTTMVVFAPMAFLPGSTAEYTRSISLVVVLALAFSLFEALLILPSHLRHLKNKPQQQSRSWFSRLQLRIANGMQYLANFVYGRFIVWLLKHKYGVITVFVGMLLISINLLNNNYVQQSFMPQISGDKIKLMVTLPDNSSYERTEQVLQQINQGSEQLIESVELSGGQLVEHVYNQVWGTRVMSELKLVDAELRAMTIEQASDKLQELIGDIPDAEEIEFRSSMNTSSPKISFRIRSNDTDALKLALNDLKNHLSKYQGINLIRDSMDKGSTEMVFALKPGAEQLGISLRDVSKQVKQAYFGQEVDRLATWTGDVRVKVRYSKQERDSIDTLQHMRIRTKDGREIPLMSVVDVTERPGVQRIYRRDGEKVASLRAEYGGTDQYSVNRDIRDNFIPQWQKRHPEVKFGSGDRGQERDDFITTVMRLEGLALLVSYMLMAIAFRSYMQPLLILSAVPFAFMGAIAGHLLHGTVYSMFSMLGILAAAGVVINDNLVLVDAINRLREKGHNAVEAVIAAGKLRFRPIVLTSMTTFIGLLPMMWANSVQAKFLVPMVVSLAYGVLLATIITLIFVPCLYVASIEVRDLWRQFQASDYYPLGNKSNDL